MNWNSYENLSNRFRQQAARNEFSEPDLRAPYVEIHSMINQRIIELLEAEVTEAV